MKKSWFCLSPLVLVFAFLFCGCSDSSSPIDAELSFDCASSITMKYGTFSDEPVYAPIVTNVDVSKLSVDYNENIINYDLTTGKITANSGGETTLIVRSGDRIATIDINVVPANYCTSLNLSKQYVVKLNNNVCEPIVPEANSNYNMGFDFISLDPNIVIVDEKGIITPIQKGSAIVQVVAKNGVDSLGYTYTYKTTTVIVEDVSTDFNIEILDENLNPLPLKEATSGFDYYELYSDKSGNAPLYVLKLSSNVNLNNKYFKSNDNKLTENESGTNSRLFTFDVGEAGYKIKGSNEDGTVLYRPFFALDSGVDFIQETLVDIGLNSNNFLYSDLIKIRVYESTSVFEVDCFYDEELTSKVEDTDNITLTLNDGEINAYFSVEINEFANAEFSILKDDNIEVFENTGKVFGLKFKTEGNYIVMICPADSMDLAKTFRFTILKQEYCNEIWLSQTKLILTLNESEDINFLVYNNLGEIEKEHGGLVVAVYDNETDLETDSVEVRLSYDNFYLKPLKIGTYTVLVYNLKIDYYCFVDIIVN